MNIYINGRFLTQKVTGPQRFALELTKSLDQLIDKGQIDRELTFFILVPKNIKFFPSFKHIEVITTGFLKGHLWEQIELPFYSWNGLLVNFCNAAPLFKRNQIVSILDAAIYGIPQAYSFLYRIWYRFMIKCVSRLSKQIITISNFSKEEIVKYCKINPQKIQIIYCGIDHIKKNKPDEKLLEKYGLLNRQYVLAVSSFNPNKNFAGIAKAMKILEDRNFDFVIAGGFDTKVFNQNQMEIPGNVIKVGYVSDCELRTLYEHAICFIFPSFYEGFGIPPVEAMVFGCPTIVSNTGALPEVCGNASFYVNPNSVESIASGIKMVVEDQSLKSMLIKSGYKQANIYTWQDSAMKLYKIIEGVICNENINV